MQKSSFNLSAEVDQISRRIKEAENQFDNENFDYDDLIKNFDSRNDLAKRVDGLRG